MRAAAAWNADFEEDPISMAQPQGIKCLLVDDDQFDRYNVRYAAERAGLNLTFYDAASVAEARRMIHLQTYGLIILDQRLPDGQGLDLAAEAQMSMLNAMTPTIMLTGLDDSQLMLGAQRAGCVEFLTKNSLNGHTLSRALRHALEKSVATIDAANFSAASDAFEMMLDGFGEMYLAQTIKPALARIMFLTKQMTERAESDAIEGQQRSVDEISSLCKMIWTRIETEQERDPAIQFN